MTTSRLKNKLIKEGLKTHECENCGLYEWLGNKIPIELHHIDGNNKNNELSNLKILCPNCHSITHNFRGRNKKRREFNVTDEQLINAILNSYNRRQALLMVGLTAYGGTYERINRILNEKNISFKESPYAEKTRKQIESINEKYGSFKKMFNQKINWPEPNELENMIRNNSTKQVGRMLGVSDNSVRKTAKKYGIDIKSISKWSKKHSS
jgi:hypothetical protein